MNLRNLIKYSYYNNDLKKYDYTSKYLYANYSNYNSSLNYKNDEARRQVARFRRYMKISLWIKLVAVVIIMVILVLVGVLHV